MLVGIKHISTGIKEFKKPARNLRFRIILNPAKNTVELCYEIIRKSKVNIKVFDLSGRLIRKWDEGIKEQGFYTKVWDLKKDGIRPGIYLLRFENEGKKITRKLVVTG